MKELWTDSYEEIVHNYIAKILKKPTTITPDIQTFKYKDI